MKQQIKSMNAYCEVLDHGIVIYSYDTPILVINEFACYTSPKKYSATTSKQKTVISRMLGHDPQEIGHEQFIELCKEVGVQDLGRA